MERKVARPEIFRKLPEAEVLHRYLTYDPDRGLLQWRERPLSDFVQVGKRSAAALHKMWNTKFAGAQAGGVRKDGYATVMIGEVNHKVHRIVWKMAHGNDPMEIDHIDGDKGNNRLENLRSVSRGANLRNKSLYANNSSGFPGVEFHSRDKVWIAKVGAGRKQVHLGSFPTKEEAIACKIGAQVMLDYHANHGRTAAMKGS